MITNIKLLKKYCTDYKNIDNYEEAVKSPLRYDLHHRREISENKSRKQLIAENLYYDRPPEELVFLEHRDHMSLHNKGENNCRYWKGKPSPWLGKHPSEETRKKISEAKKGKHHSEETRQKMSAAKKGEKCYMFGKSKSTEWKKKMSEVHRGRHWHLENGKRIYTD